MTLPESPNSGHTSAFYAAGSEPGNGQTHLFHSGRSETGPDREHDVTGTGKNRAVEAEGFADQALDPVSPDRIPDLARYTDTQAAVLLIAAQADQGKPLAVQPSAPAVNPVKLRGFPEQAGLREPELFHSSGREPFTPLGTPALDNGLTGPGPHAAAKAVGTFTLEITGLKSSLTHD